MDEAQNSSMDGAQVIDMRSDAAPLRKQVEHMIRNAIISGRFKPGERLRERELVDLFNVSRTSLREALRQIEAEGLVTLEPNRGPVVTTVGYEEAEEIYEARGVLEAQACSGFALKATSAQMRTLQEVFERMQAHARADDVEQTLLVKDEFYKVIFEGCGNRVIRSTLTQLHNRVMLLRRMSLSEPDRLPETMHEISQLFDALKLRDEQGAWKAAAHHIRQASRVALRAMRRTIEQSVPRQRRKNDGQQ